MRARLCAWLFCSLGCGCAPAAVLSPPVATVAVASPTATPVHASAPTGPLLSGAVFLTVMDESGFVYDPNVAGLTGLDVPAVDACYAAFVRGHPAAGAGLPGWARFQTRTGPSEGERSETTALDDSGLPSELRACLAAALAKTRWVAGPVVKEVYIGFR